MLLEAMEAGVCDSNVDDFYFLARAALVKDEKNFDRFDQVFGEFFQGLMKQSRELFEGGIPERWLRAMTQRVFSEEEIARLETMDFDELMEELRKRLEEQKGEHSGGNKWHGRDLALWQFRRQSCRGSHRRRRGRRQRNESMEKAGIPQPDRRCRNRHSEYQDRAAAAPQVPA